MYSTEKLKDSRRDDVLDNITRYWLTNTAVSSARLYWENKLGFFDGGYFFQTRLNVGLPGVEREAAQTLVDEAHQICPYSKATRGNIDVAINLI